MKARRHERFRVAITILVLLVAPLFSMHYHGRLDRSQTLAETALMKVTGPGQNLMHNAFAQIVGTWKHYVYLVDVEEQNDNLRVEIDKLRMLVSRARGLDEENRRLREMLGFEREQADLNLQSARIIARETSPFFSVSRIRLDQGTAGLVGSDMPVVTASGIVGRTEKVAGDYCDVMLLTDSRSRIDVQVPGKGISGMLVGTGDSLPVFRFPYQKTHPVKGDLLITTGHDRLFPKGLVAGYIASGTVKQVGTQLECKVEPAIRLAALQEVFIVVGSEQSLAVPDIWKEAKE
jgi:rod shape-determining protein MreC